MALALLVGWWRGSDLARAAAVGLYVGGAALVSVALVMAQAPPFELAGHQFDRSVTDPAERRRWQAGRGAYVAVGVALLALGVVVETLSA